MNAIYINDAHNQGFIDSKLKYKLKKVFMNFHTYGNMRMTKTHESERINKTHESKRMKHGELNISSYIGVQG